jgi:hypothetical protein
MGGIGKFSWSELSGYQSAKGWSKDKQRASEEPSTLPVKGRP